MKNRFFLLVFAVTSQTLACGHKTPQKETENRGDKIVLEDTNVAEEEVYVEEPVTTLAALLALDTKDFYFYYSLFEEPVTVRKKNAVALTNRVVTMYTAIDESEADMVRLKQEPVQFVEIGGNSSLNSAADTEGVVGMSLIEEWYLLAFVAVAAM